MLNPMDLSDRVYLVTGASSGIGQATAILLSELGAKVILVARDESRLRTTLNQLSGTEHRIAPMDLRGVDDLCAWMKGLAREAGLISGLVHSAGVEVIQPLRFLSANTHREVMDLNFTAAVMLAKAFRQKGVRATEGSVVVLSSVAGVVGQAGHISYCSSKAALGGFVRAAAIELASEGIRVNCVAPGWVEGTEMTKAASRDRTPEQAEAIRAQHPIGVCEPRDVANAVAFLLADVSKKITGITLPVDGGFTAQ